MKSTYPLTLLVCRALMLLVLIQVALPAGQGQTAPSKAEREQARAMLSTIKSDLQNGKRQSHSDFGMGDHSLSSINRLIRKHSMLLQVSKRLLATYLSTAAS